MKESRGDARKESVIRSNPDRNKAATRAPNREKPDSMPNPVKGLTLSLYPMIKQH